MRKQLLYAGMAVMALMSSCSSDDSVESVDVSQVKVENSDVEIHLSTSSVRTRASVESDDDGSFAVDSMGVFCLAKADLNVNPVELPINWSRYVSNDHWSIWMDNVKCNAVKDASGTAIKWADKDAVYMYPTGNWHSYDFYAYYPYQQSTDVSGEVVSTTIALDGTQDVIWGRTESDEQYAYSAKYFRNNKAKSPALSMSHRFMRITFSIIAGRDSTGSKEPAKTMGVKSLSVVNVPAYAKLIIADRYNPENDGKIEADWNYGLTSYDMKDAGDAAFPELDAEKELGYWVKEDEQTVGQGFLLPVPEEGHTFRIHVVLQDKSGRVFDLNGYPIDLALKEGFTFEAGKSYNVRIAINGPEEIKLRASLKGWESVEDSMDDREF